MKNEGIKADLYELIDKTEDSKVLEEVRFLLLNRDENQDFWDFLPKGQRESVERGIEQAAKGETMGHEEVMKKYNKWLTK